MPMVIRDDGDLFRPVVVCDHCGKEIADAEDGNYHWTWDPPDGTHHPIRFTHKRCCLAFERDHPEYGYAALLTLLPLYLGQNLRVNPRKAFRLSLTQNLE